MAWPIHLLQLWFQSWLAFSQANKQSARSLQITKKNSIEYIFLIILCCHQAKRIEYDKKTAMAWDFLSVKAEFRKFWQTLANLPRISLTCKYESNQHWIWIQSGSWPEQEYIKKKVYLKPLQELGLVWPVKILSRNMNCLLRRFFRFQFRTWPEQELQKTCSWVDCTLT